MLLNTQAAPDARERANIEHSLDLLAKRFPDVPRTNLTVPMMRPTARWARYGEQQDIEVGEERYLAPPDSVRLCATDPEADLHSEDAPRRLGRTGFYLLTGSDLYEPLRTAGAVEVREGEIVVQARSLRQPSAEERRSGTPKSALVVGQLEVRTPGYTYTYPKRRRTP